MFERSALALVEIRNEVFILRTIYFNIIQFTFLLLLCV